MKEGRALCRSFNGAATAAAVSDDEGMERVRGEQKVIRALVPPPQPQPALRSVFKDPPRAISMAAEKRGERGRGRMGKKK